MCTAAVRETLQSQPGVVKVEINFPGKTANCQVDQEKFDADKAIEALAKADFAESTIVQPKKENAS